jgi:hypothetical protein
MGLRRQNENVISPQLINLVSYLLFSMPLTYIIFLGAFYNLPIAKLAQIFFGFVYIFHSLFSVFVGWSLHKMRPYAWHVFFALMLIMLVEQFYVALFLAENHFVFFALSIAVSLILALLFLVKAELRVPYFSPRIAWWESDPRYKISLPTQITTPDHLFDGEIMDISVGGCFIKTKAILIPDQIIHLRFNLFENNFGYSGRVVWKTEATVTLPRGIGVKFIGIQKHEQHDLKATVRKLRNLSNNFQQQRREERALLIQKKIENLLGPK